MLLRRTSAIGKSWYCDETKIKIGKNWDYLYRAIDKYGRLVDIRLAKTRSSQTTTAFFEKAVETTGVVPEKVTTDKEVTYPGAIKEVLGRKVEHRTNKYLNNGALQDHRGIKQRYYPMQSFKSESCAAKFIAAFEEQRFYFRFRRCPGDDLISLRECRNEFKGKYLRLKDEFLKKKSVWKQREFVLNSYAGNKSRTFVLENSK